ncbi:MAG: phospholipase D-like domain-containing protein [Planctomycetota bacterium]
MIHVKRLSLSFLVALVSALLYLQQGAFSSDAFFTTQEIHEQILRAIEDSAESIDVAVPGITSKEILHALAKARQRGVHVRLVIGTDRPLLKGPLSGLSKREGFAAKVLPRKELIHSNFAIFDCKTMVTGSYRWNKAPRKVVRDCALFITDTRVLVKHQREFDSLFHGGEARAIPEGISTIEPKPEKPADTLPVATPTIAAPGQKVLASNHGAVITEGDDGYINMNFEEFNKIFGMVSDLTDDQKESLWHPCIGKRVRWDGKVSYIGWSLMSGWMLSATHGDTGVEVKLNPANKSHFSKVKYGNTVTYTGKLDSRVTRVFPYKLEDGDVLDVKNTLPTPLTKEEMIQNPDIVPICQGPKKIPIVESFEDIDKIFGTGSSLSDAQKDEAWERYKGKYVNWSGQIAHKNLNVAVGLRIGITHKEIGDVELMASPSKKETILKFQEGEAILYSGRLLTRRKNNSPYVLDDGDIVTLK